MEIRGRVARWGAGLSLALLLLITLTEIDRLVGSTLDTDSGTRTFAELMGPARLFNWESDVWAFEYAGVQATQFDRFLTWYLVVDFVFIAVYATLLFVASPDRRHHLMLRVLVAADIAENVAASAQAWPAMIVFVTLVKWLAVLGLLAYWVVVRRLHLAPRWRRALFIQRFGLVAAAPVALLSAVPASGIFDQLPDVQRRWLTPFSPGDLGWAGAAHLTLVVTLYLLGRARYQWAQRCAEGPRDPARLKYWFVGPVLLLGVALVAEAAGGAVSWRRLATFSAVPLLVALASLGFRRWGRAGSFTPPRRSFSPEEVAAIGRVGAVVAVGVAALAGVGMVRAMTAPALQGSGGRFWVALAAGALTAVAVWLPWMAGLLETVASWVDAARDRLFGEVSRDSRLRRLERKLPPGFVLLGASLVGVVLLALYAVWVVERTGALAAVVLSLAVMTALVGSTVTVMQETRPPELFVRLKFAYTPVVPLLLLAIVLAGLIGKEGEIHAVRDEPGASPGRPNLASVWRAWVTQDTACRTPEKPAAPPRTDDASGAEASGFTLRPLLLVAAEGGGIRASYWAAAGMQEIAAFGPKRCASRATLLSGGASGGALGMTVARFTDAPASQVKEMADDEALGAAAVGLVLRDQLAAATGIRLPLAFAPEEGGEAPPTGWTDRAGLMERVWATKAPALADDFLEESGDVPGVAEEIIDSLTGALVLTSTEVAQGCRALVSQIRLGPPGAAGDSGSLRCDDVGGPGPHSIDLFAVFAGEGGVPAASCLGPVQAATAGLLASRFPYVTPSGEVGPCPPSAGRVTQLVDGGYTDNSGLGALVDLGPRWLRLVREHNARVRERVIRELPVDPDRPWRHDLVVPFLVYLDNGPGADVTTPDRGTTMEALVPPVTALRARSAQATPAALLHRAAAVLAGERLCSPREHAGVRGEAVRRVCSRVRAALSSDGWSRRVVVVHQVTDGTVAAPLGWVLSQDSIVEMDEDLSAQAGKRCASRPSDPVCRRGFAGLGDLAVAFGDSGGS